MKTIKEFRIVKHYNEVGRLTRIELQHQVIGNVKIDKYGDYDYEDDWNLNVGYNITSESDLVKIMDSLTDEISKYVDNGYSQRRTKYKNEELTLVSMPVNTKVAKERGWE